MKKNIIPDINLQNEIQKNKILNSRDFYKGKSFRFAHEWHDGITYFNDKFYTDFVVYKNVLLACKNTHTSNSLNVPVIIYDGIQPIGVENTEYWSFVLSGIVNPDASFKVQFSPSVDVLPKASEHLGEIFVVGPVGSSGNAYEEYIAIHTPSYDGEYTWELVGGGNTSIDLSNYVTKSYLSSINQELISYVNEKNNYQDMIISGKQNTLISGVNVKTINGQDILGEGDIVIETDKVDLSKYYTKEEIENKGYLNSIPTEYITEVELNNTINNFSFDGGVTNFT